MNNKPHISASSKEFISFSRGVTEKDQLRSTTHEAQALREIVTKLRQELLQVQAEKQKVQDQLNCLVYMVKKAWSGDEIAAVHVANIVGVAPPVIKVQHGKDELQLIAQSRALHNWARLSVNLLNRVYNDGATSLQRRQLEYFNDREQLLDDEMHHNSSGVQHGRKKRLKSASPMPPQKSNTLDLLLRKGELESMKVQEEKSQIEVARGEMREKHKRKNPHGHQKTSLERKDSVQRQLESENLTGLFIAPMSRSAPKTESKDQVTVEDVSTDEEDQDKGQYVKRAKDTQHQHVRSHSANSGLSSAVQQTRSRPKSSIVKGVTVRPPSTGSRKQRPFSAQVKPTYKPQPSSQTLRNTHELNKIEKELKATTLMLQKRLCILENGIV